MSRTPRVLLALVLLLGSLAAITVTAGGASARPATPRERVAPAQACATPATAARLRVQVIATGGTVDVHVAPSQVTGRKDRTTSGGATTGYLSDGVRVQVPVGSVGSVDTEIIAVDATKAAEVTVKVDKAATTTAIVTVSSVTSRTRAVGLHALGRGTTFTTKVPRIRLFDPAYSLPKADDRKLVLAAYYPWFTAGGWENLLVAERPVDPRSVWSPEGVLSMTQQAKANGVDGFAVSWMGADKNGAAFDLAADAALKTGNVVLPYLETAGAMGQGGVPTVERWLREAVARTGPASLMVGGAPVVFVWNMGAVSGADWAAMVARLGRPVHIVGDADTATHGLAMKGFHSYLPPTDLTGAATRNTMRSAWYRGSAALDPVLTPFLHVGTVSPGFDDRALRGVDRPVVSREGGRYGATWDAALAGDPDMVLVTSWNEWFEASEIEPGTVFGSSALTETKTRSAAWKSAACPG